MSAIITILLLAFAIGVSPAAIRPPGNDLQAPLGNQVRTYKTHQDPSSDSIVRFENTSDVDGSYHYAYETSQGTKVEEQGVQKLVADNQQASHVTGGYSYSDPDGAEISLTYVADENGFQPKGAHLPVSPPIPHYILRALQYIIDHPYNERARN